MGLLPRSEAWADLRATGVPGDYGTDDEISGADLRLLADIWQLRPAADTGSRACRRMGSGRGMVIG